MLNSLAPALNGPAGAAAPDAADVGVGGPSVLEDVAGEAAVVVNAGGMLGTIRRKLQVRLVCVQLPQQGLFSSH